MSDEQQDKDIEEFYRRTNNHEKRISIIESREPLLEDILNKNTLAYEKLAETLQEIEKSMVVMSNKIDMQEQNMKDMKEDFVEANKNLNDEIAKANQNTTTEISNLSIKTSKDIKEVNARVDTIDEKGKFDIRDFIKHNWGWIMALLLAGAAFISNYIKV